MTHTVDLVVAGAGRGVFGAAADALRRRLRVMVLLRSSDRRVARRLRRRLHLVARAHGGTCAVESHVEVVCVDGVGGVEAVVFRNLRTGRVDAVNATAFATKDWRRQLLDPLRQREQGADVWTRTA